MSAAKQVVERWRREGVEMNAAAPLETLRRFEKAWGLALPAALRELLSEANGMPPAVTDVALFRFWPVNEYEAEASIEGGVLFADFALWAHCYAFDVQERVWIVGGAEPLKVAPSLEEFLRRYGADPRSVAG